MTAASQSLSPDLRGDGSSAEASPGAGKTAADPPVPALPTGWQARWQLREEQQVLGPLSLRAPPLPASRGPASLWFMDCTDRAPVSHQEDPLAWFKKLIINPELSSKYRLKNLKTIYISFH